MQFCLYTLILSITTCMHVVKAINSACLCNMGQKLYALVYTTVSSHIEGTATCLYNIDHQG